VTTTPRCRTCGSRPGGAAKRADREATEGAVTPCGRARAAVVELRCETDFVAKATSSWRCARPIVGQLLGAVRR